MLTQEVRTLNVQDVDFADPAFLACPWPNLLRLQVEDPIFWSENQKGWIVTRHADVRAAYADPRLSARRVEQMFRTVPPETRERVATARKFISLNVNRLDGDDHRRIRILMMKAFTGSIVRSLAPTIQLLVNQILDEAEADGEFDFSEKVSAVLPTLVIQHMLGIPSSERATLFTLASAFTNATSATRMTPELLYRLDEALLTMNVIFNALIKEREQQPGDDLISTLVHARDGLERLSHDELLACFHAIIVAGAETTAHTLATQLVQIARRADLQDMVRGNQEAAFTVVTELLRYPGTVKCMTRMAAEDFFWQGRHIRKGDLVWMMNAGANVDPTVFDDALTIDPGRNNRDSMAFGPGLHHCIGHLLTRQELSTFFASAFERFDIEIPEQTLEYVPSSVFYGYRSLQVRFVPRSVKT